MLFLLGLLVGSLGEYWGHRLLHFINFRPHVDHHKENASHGWIREFWGYFWRAIPPIYAVGVAVEFMINGHEPFLYGPHFWQFTSGLILHIAFTAYTHELYHTDPNLVFWINRPVHRFHHERNEWHHNFGWTTPLWDHIFGTYRDDERWVREPLPWTAVLSGILKIRWI